MSVAYAVAAVAYVSVAVLGYAAFGDAVDSNVLLSLAEPMWAIATANAMVVVHFAASYQVRVLCGAREAIWTVNHSSATLQVFTQPVFEAIETALTGRLPALRAHARVMRIGTRGAYVACTGTVAASLPFFGDLMGLISAAGFVPMAILMPVVLWGLARPQKRLAERLLNGTILVTFSLLAVAAFAGSSWRIYQKSRTYAFWS